MVSPEALYSTLLDEVQAVLIGNEEVVERLIISLLTRGHVLLEGVRGSRRRPSRTCSRPRAGWSTATSR